MTMTAIVCADDDVLPWPSCERMDPPMIHYPIRSNSIRDQWGKFQRAYYSCDRCDRGLGVMTSEQAEAMRGASEEDSDG